MRSRNGGSTPQTEQQRRAAEQERAKEALHGGSHARNEQANRPGTSGQ